MDKMILLQKFSDRFFIENQSIIKQKERKKIVEQLALHIEYIIFNIVSMMCLIAILNNTSQITKKTLDVGKSYVTSTCKITYPSKTMMGGMGSATYMGIAEPMYTRGNIGSDLLTVDFAGDTARNQIGGAKQSNLKTLTSAIDTYITFLLDHHKMSASKTIKSNLKTMIKYHIDCVIDHLKMNKTIKYKSLINMLHSHKALKPLK